MFAAAPGAVATDQTLYVRRRSHLKIPSDPSMGRKMLFPQGPGQSHLPIRPFRGGFQFFLIPLQGCQTRPQGSFPRRFPRFRRFGFDKTWPLAWRYRLKRLAKVLCSHFIPSTKLGSGVWRHKC